MTFIQRQNSLNNVEADHNALRGAIEAGDDAFRRRTRDGLIGRIHRINADIKADDDLSTTERNTLRENSAELRRQIGGQAYAAGEADAIRDVITDVETQQAAEVAAAAAAKQNTPSN